MSGSNVPLVISVEQFRNSYPVFENSTEFSDGTLTEWLQLASNLLNPLAWSTLLSLGVGLFAAHNLTLFRKTGGSVDGQAGLVLSKTVGKVSVDFDTTATSLKDGGPFNLTAYGTQFLFYARMVGAAPLQITGPMQLAPLIPPAYTPTQ